MELTCPDGADVITPLSCSLVARPSVGDPRGTQVEAFVPCEPRDFLQPGECARPTHETGLHRTLPHAARAA